MLAAFFIGCDQAAGITLLRADAMNPFFIELLPLAS
jgi:hypothetical protein